jgi:hypothetical protein
MLIRLPLLMPAKGQSNPHAKKEKGQYLCRLRTFSTERAATFYRYLRANGKAAIPRLRALIYSTGQT